jgi:hypothetical protein
MKPSRASKFILSILLLLANMGCMAVSASSPDALREMIGKDHIGTGSELTDPALKETLNSHIDASAEALAAKAASGASRTELLEEMRALINAIDRDTLDTEDAESVASAFEAMLEPLGLDSSDGLLNTWMYGFDPS